MPIGYKMSCKLHKVRVYTDVFVMAKNDDEAVKIAKPYAAKEVEFDYHAETRLVDRVSDIPDGWKDIVPYCMEGSPQEERKCIEIARSLIQSPKKEVHKEEKTPTTTTTTTKPPIQIGRVSGHKHGLARSEGSMRL